MRRKMRGVSNAEVVGGARWRWRCAACGSARVYEEMRANMNDAEDVVVFGRYYCAECEHECAVEREAL